MVVEWNHSAGRIRKMDFFFFFTGVPKKLPQDFRILKNCFFFHYYFKITKMTEREKLVPFLLFLLQEAYYVVFPTSFFLFYQNNVHMLQL